LANLQPTDNVKRDGIDISDYLFNPGVKREDRPYFYWHVDYLQAVRYGDWKLSLFGNFLEVEKQNIVKSTYDIQKFLDKIELYNLREDPGEMNNVSDKYPEKVAQILTLAEKEKKALGAWTNKGPEVRKTLWVKSPKPLIPTWLY
jgi:arylsulfatase